MTSPSDPPRVAALKLEVVLPEGSERAWFRQRLLPLLGIEASSSAQREELFEAWRRFLELIAEQRPTVLVFEDLHWADEALLAFLEHLADRAEGVPLLLVGTARPDLYERHPDYRARLRNATPINLSPLSQEETARLASALLETAEIPAALHQPILDRAEGNPLYAEEFVRLLKDRDLLVKQGSSWGVREGAEVPVPDSLHALIAARLDTLEPESKSMLADAAVIGKVFWAGAVAAMGGHDVQVVTDTLRELSRNELVRPARRSSMEGEAEYAFWHILTRDVAYAQLPRAARAARHVAAAAWLESKAPERVEDLADVLAYHYTTALELAQAAGQTGQTAELEAPALRYLTLAAARALGLNTTAALTSFERALALTPSGHPERPEALAGFGEAALHGGRSVEAREALEEAITSFRVRGDLSAATGAMATLGSVLIGLGDRRWVELPGEALALLEPLPPGPEFVGALGEASRAEILQGRDEAAVRYAERALALAEELGFDRPVRALGHRGVARARLGDPAGLEDMREAITLATEAGQGRGVATLHANLGYLLWLFEGPAAFLEVLHAGIAFAQSRGLADFNTGGTLEALVDRGGLDEALAVAAQFGDRLEASEAVWDLIVVRAVQARILTLRGQSAQAAGSLRWLESRCRTAGSPEVAVVGLASSALARAALGQDEAAAALLAEIEATPGAHGDISYGMFLPAMVRTALAIGDADLAARLVDGVEPRHPYTEHALVAAGAALAEARGAHQPAADAYAGAADRWERFGVVPEQGLALLGQGRCLLALGRPADATHALRAAREILHTLKAAPALAETDALLQQASAISS
jgi:tetratricopeptide (TPR) repeat protein